MSLHATRRGRAPLAPCGSTRCRFFKSVRGAPHLTAARNARQVANLTASESVTVAAADAGATVVTSVDLSLHSALGSCSGGALYRVVHTKLQHDAAAASCAAQGGQLAAFETRAQAAAAAARKCLPTYWVGASDAAAEGDWRWPDGAAFAADSPLALLAPGQPNGGSGAEEQDCAAMAFGRARGDRWIRDVACVQRLPPLPPVLTGHVSSLLPY